MVNKPSIDVIALAPGESQVLVLADGRTVVVVAVPVSADAPAPPEDDPPPGQQGVTIKLPSLPVSARGRLLLTGVGEGDLDLGDLTRGGVSLTDVLRRARAARRRSVLLHYEPSGTGEAAGITLVGAALSRAVAERSATDISVDLTDDD